MPADACIGDDAGQRNKIDRHEQTDAYAVPSDSVAVLAGPKEEASQNEIFDSVPNDLREPEAEEHVEEYSMADCEDVATETLHEGDHIDRRPFVKELEQEPASPRLGSTESNGAESDEPPATRTAQDGRAKEPGSWKS